MSRLGGQLSCRRLLQQPTTVPAGPGFQAQRQALLDALRKLE